VSNPPDKAEAPAPSAPSVPVAPVAPSTSVSPTKVEALDPATPKHPSFVFLAVASILVLASDLGSKAWAVRTLEKPGQWVPPKEIIKGRLSFVLARNPGGAWGMLHDQPEKLRKPFFILVSIVAVVVIVSMYRKLDVKQRALKWGLPLVLGGALGNLVDRIRYGKVIDFIDVVYWKSATKGPMHWPTFNVADIAICVGVLLMAIDFVFPQKRTVRRVIVKKKVESVPPPAPGAAS
jgi:signal peptidase II